MTCKMCEERGKDWTGSDPICCFDGDDNWNCATVNKIRDFCCEETPHPLVDYRYCQDDKYAVICIDGINGGWMGFALFVQWYKRRGRTDAMMIIGEKGETRKPIEKDLLSIIRYLEEGLC